MYINDDENRCLYEFVGNDSNTSVQQAPTMLTSTATSLIANQSNIPIFTSIFSYYESKSPSELGKSNGPQIFLHFHFQITLN